jgi:hypothetical protein
VTQLLFVSTIPYDGQILFFDAGDDGSNPFVFVGSESVASRSHGLAVKTRADLVTTANDLVPVKVEVWLGEAPTDFGGVIVWTGPITCGERGFTVGSVIGSDTHPIDAGPGVHSITVLVQPEVEPNHVVFVLDPKPFIHVPT